MTAMATNTGQAWRIAGWSLLAVLLTLPALAMKAGGDVKWTTLDSVAAALLLGLLGLGVEFAAGRAGGARPRLGMGVAVLTAVLLVWVNLAVGVIGSENNDANLMFAGVLAVAVGGACLARFQPAAMARAMAATAAANTCVGLAAVLFRLGVDGPAWPYDVLGATVMFDGLWLVSALLFRRAAR